MLLIKMLLDRLASFLALGHIYKVFPTSKFRALRKIEIFEDFELKFFSLNEFDFVVT